MIGFHFLSHGVPHRLGKNLVPLVSRTAMDHSVLLSTLLGNESPTLESLGAVIGACLDPLNHSPDDRDYEKAIDVSIVVGEDAEFRYFGLVGCDCFVHALS
jgi:hypothetical protein